MSEAAQGWGLEAERMLVELAACTEEEGRLTRRFLSPAHRRAADLVAGWMRAAGLEVVEDALGTVRGSRGPVPRLLIGSHLDTVINAGKYDGMLGIVAGILAAKALRDRKLPFGLEVIAFGEEEGSRFAGSLTSSLAIAGALPPTALEQRDRDGMSMRAALAAFGKGEPDLPALAMSRPDALAYVEVHIEQGPVLEAEGQALGVVTGIIGQTRQRVRVGGQAGHAGTVPMHLRRDALAGAAAMMLELEAIARAHADDAMVATVGIIEAKPGAGNVIPAEVNFSIDLRSTTDPRRLAALASFAEKARRIADERRLTLDIETAHDIPSVHCDGRLRDQLAAAIRAGGGLVRELPSGAGHDGQAMARLCPIAMLFVRCRAGLSHHPDEFASPDDMGLAIAALIRFIEGFDPTGLLST